jgi:fatty-acyl-CoA synthase
MDGMLNTGDLGYVDDTGRIHIAGRTKDLIIRSGHNIDPLMIENAMQRHPAVALAAAVGMPDAYAGELPVCYVALRPGATVTEAELHAHAEAAIAERPAWPKHIFVIDSIPVTSVGKIYKPTLRCDAAARLVTRILREELRIFGAEVQATEGGSRGLKVSVRLPARDTSATQRVREALGAFLFETAVAD